MNRKQIESMFSSSIEVLESLVREYEERLGFEEQEGEDSKRDDVEAMFERFYDRLKFMLETVCEQLHQYQSTKISSPQSISKTLQNTYDESLFPQSINAPYPITKGPSTDQELYQLVVEMKTKSSEDREKVISLEKALTQAKRQNKQLEAKLKATTIKCKNKEGQLLLIAEQFDALNCEKQNQAHKLKEKCAQISSLQLQIKQLQTQLQEKELQITNLTAKQRLNLVQNTQIKEELTFKLTNLQQKNSQLLKENKKLRLIMAKKLSFLKQNQSADKENVFLEQNKAIKNKIYSNINTSSQLYIKELVQSLISSQRFISQTVQKQLCAFLSNLIKSKHISSQKGNHQYLKQSCPK